jgi:hypothetical protein
MLLYGAKLFIPFLRSLQKGFIGKKVIFNYSRLSFKSWKK